MTSGEKLEIIRKYSRDCWIWERGSNDDIADDLYTITIDLSNGRRENRWGKTRDDAIALGYVMIWTMMHRMVYHGL